MAAKSADDMIRDLSTSPQVTIDEDLQQSIQNHPSCISNGDSSTQTLLYAIIRGDVAPIEKALTSNYAIDMVILKMLVEMGFSTRSDSGWCHPEGCLYRTQEETQQNCSMG